MSTETITEAQQETREAALCAEREITRIQLRLHRLYLAQAAQSIQAQFPAVTYFELDRDEHDGDELVVKNAMDVQDRILGEEMDEAIRSSIFAHLEADDFNSVLGDTHEVAEVAAYLPDREDDATLTVEDLEAGDEANLDLEFTIRETINYTGCVTVNREDLAAWLKQRGCTTLSGHELHEFTSARNIEHTEKDGDVQGQEWSDVAA